MLRFNPSQPVPAFSLDRRDLARKRGMKKREWRLLVMLPFVLVVIGAFINYLLGYAKMIPHGPFEPVIEERVLKPMATPRLNDADPLPSATAIAAELKTVRELIADQANVRHDDVVDALTLAWGAELQHLDLAQPPIPQRVLARDLLLGGVQPGAAVILHGRLLDSVAAPLGPDGAQPTADYPIPQSAMPTGYQRLAVQLDEQQIAQVLAPISASELVVGRDIQVLGRFLGSAPAPTGTTGDTQMPLVLARQVRASERSEEQTDPDLVEMRGIMPATLPTDLFTNVGDERSVLETRPYYFLLGQARVDRDGGLAGYATAANGNDRADDIHQKPEEFRGQPFKLTGFVYRCWEDVNVARDQPFGVNRVLRILMWNRDAGKITELLNGKPTLKSQILRLYEVCLISDQVAPARGAKISVDARFFKFRAIPVNADSLRDQRNDVRRQSDNVYTFAFVGVGYSIIPALPPYELRWLDLSIVAACVALGVLIVVLRRRDQRLEKLVGEQVRRLRATRKALNLARLNAVHRLPAAQASTAISTPIAPPAESEKPAAP